MSSQPLPQPERRKGFTMYQNDVLLDWPRLASGDAQVFLLMYVNSETTGAARAPKTKAPYWSRPISIEELAGFARCTVRAIQLASDDLSNRGVIERKKSGAGAWKFHIPFETWPNLPDRPPKVVCISDEAEDAEEDTDDATSTKGTVIPVFEKPQRVKPGARPRPKELPAAAGKLRLCSTHEIEYTATLCDGLLQVELTVTDQGKPEAKRNSFRFEDGNSNKTKRNDFFLPQIESFQTFERACRLAGLSYSKVDLKDMLAEWRGLSAEDQAKAVQGLADRKAAGEFDNPMYRPLPVNYLAKRIWERAVRKRMSKADQKADEVRRRHADVMGIIEGRKK